MFNAKFAEYEKNPEVTKKRMFYEAMEDILPQLRVIIDGTDSTTTSNNNAGILKKQHLIESK